MKDAKNRILVIDDESSILRMLDLRLSRLGPEVETALTREDAIKKHKSELKNLKIMKYYGFMISFDAIEIQNVHKMGLPLKC